MAARKLPEVVFPLFSEGAEQKTTGMECRVCKARVWWTLPIELGLYVKLGRAFIWGHRGCRHKAAGGES